MSFSKVSDGAFTPDEGHGMEARSSTGTGVVSLGYAAGSMGQLRGCSCSSRRQERRKRMKGKETSHTQLQGSLSHAPLTLQGRLALLVAVEPSEGVPHPLPTPDVVPAALDGL